MTAMKMTVERRARALLLDFVGKEVKDLFDTLSDEEKDNDFKSDCEALM